MLPPFLFWNRSPCLKSTISFPCPSLRLFWLCCLPPPQPLLPAATSCSGATASETTAPGPGAFAAGPGGFLLPPTCWGSRKPPGPAAKARRGERGAENNGLLDAPLQFLPWSTLPHPGTAGCSRQVGREPWLTSTGLPRKGKSRQSPSLLAGFPGTEAQGERDWAGIYQERMSQVKRKSQRMEWRENAALKTDGNSKRKARVNKRNDHQKEHAGYKGKKTWRDGKKKRKVILQEKKN